VESYRRRSAQQGHAPAGRKKSWSIRKSFPPQPAKIVVV